ncbi:MAG TPA: SDR family oxidoreductase [Euzebya sp.]|nr:SDR family oxidoreductase [Euzebya sp.]
MTSIAVVTGGTRGIGLAVARRLAVAGHAVTALARSAPDAPEAAIGFRACDVTDEAQVMAAFAAIGEVDVLVNNAGVSSSAPLHRTTTHDWARNLAVNATAPFLCTRAVLPGMTRRGSGRIITVASTAALEGTPYTAAYSASKHAVLGLMRVLAAEVEGSGVTASTVCPTFVDTDMTAGSIATIAEATGLTEAQARQQLVAMTPHGRIISAEEVATAVVDLLANSDNGQEILLDGRP